LSAVEVTGLVKKFGGVVAVDDVSFEVEDGEIVTLLGPSGCGKTTTLRCIAGLERPDAGEIRVGDTPVSSSRKGVFVPPEKRNLGMVFQSYAIWPHMTVFQNISYGLEVKKMSKAKIKEKVQEAMTLTNLKGLEERYPSQLSGGQQQRVALSRSLALEPEVLLLDEPLSNLDTKLRESMRFELKELQHRLKKTAVYVTHDQTEAMVLSNRIIVMNQGKIMQIDTPSGLHNRPINEFVADFLGGTNFLTGTVKEKHVEGGVLTVETNEGLNISVPISEGAKEGHKVLINIRPLSLTIHRTKPMDKANVWEGKIERRGYVGDFVDYWVSVGGKELRIQQNSAVVFQEGERVYVQTYPERCIIIPK
jgi:iron(III) transport system ATP-binding protein